MAVYLDMQPNAMKFELIYRVNGEIKSGFGMTFHAIAEIHPRWESAKRMFEWITSTPEKLDELNK